MRSIKTMTSSSKINRTDVWSLYEARQLKFSSFGSQPLAEVPDTRAITGTRTFEK